MLFTGLRKSLENTWGITVVENIVVLLLILSNMMQIQ